MTNLDKSIEEEILTIVEKYQKENTRLLNYLIVDDVITFFSPIGNGSEITAADLQKVAEEESLQQTGDYSIADMFGYVPELIERDMIATRNFISLIELFMLLATLISLLGLVAMSAYYVGLQTRNIAVRKVFGGTVATEAHRAVREYMVLVGIAILIGIPIAIVLAQRYLMQFYYRIDGYGWVFVVAAVIALAISFLAVLSQTLKAAKANPAVELKKE